MTQNKITIFGGAGFLGQYIAENLAKTGAHICIASRHPEQAANIKTAAPIGKITFCPCNIRDKNDIEHALKGTSIAINLVGVLFSKGQQNFNTIHAQSAENIAKAAKKAKLKRLIHISALGIDKTKKSHYASSKLAGEEAVLAAFPQATILRPSILFGAEDNFFNQFAQIACVSPFLPLFGNGATRFQPVYVGDVAQAVANALKNSKTQGKTYELGGPKTYSYKELMQFILTTIKRPRLLLPIPYNLGHLLGRILQLLPKPPLTSDQVTLLKVDNVVSKNALTFKQLNIQPQPIEAIVPGYLQRFRKPLTT